MSEDELNTGVDDVVGQDETVGEVAAESAGIAGGTDPEAPEPGRTDEAEEEAPPVAVTQAVKQSVAPSR